MKTNLPSIFKAFQRSDDYFEILNDPENSRKYLLTQLFYVVLFSFLYGIIMGSYNGVLQSLVTGIKMPCLIVLSLLICFPALYVVQSMIGSTMTIYQMANIILAGFFVFSTIALSFAPVIIFFMITSDSYSFLKLLHVAIFTFSGIFAVKTIINGLKFSCEKKNIYPKLGMTIFKIWVVILAFVSSQLAWNLRPFIGSRDMTFELFRVREGNFYVAVIQSAANLFKPADKSNQDKQNKSPKNQPDSISNKNYVERR
ncbi:MAG TPA: actin-binding WH2 domain-containing protein [Ignavibacteria bacterium]